MSKIDELIAQYCSEGVEFKEFGEIAKIQRGASPRPIQTYITDDESGVPWIKIGDTKPGSKYVINTAQKITAEGAKKSRVLKKGDFIISNSMSYGRPYILNITGAIHDGWASISNFENNLNSDFLYHYLTSKIVQDYWDSKINSGSVSNLNADIIKSLTIPVPPIQIQEEIVDILDKFTALEAELEAELEARTRQYEYYRNQLLAFEGKDVEWKTLGDVANYSKNRIAANEINLDSYVGVDNLLQNKRGKTFSSYVPTAGNLTQFIDDDILIGNIRPYLKKIWKSNITGGTNGDVLVIRISNEYKGKLISDYLYYLLSSDGFFDYNMQYAKGAKMPRGDKDSILKYRIPIPPLSEQERIVAILDKFDALVNDISVGLPAEIQARKQQYEYYRGKLLMFEPLAIAEVQ